MITFVRKQWKQILIILMVYTLWSLAAFLFLIRLQGLETTLKQFGTGKMLYINFIHTIVKGTIVYYILIYHLAIPLIKTRKWKKILLQVILFFIALTAYEYVWNFNIQGSKPTDAGYVTPNVFFLTAALLDVVIIMISVFFATLITSNEMRKHKEELEKEKLKAELAAIKYQINPHFLFNSLSFIYTKTIKTSPEAAHTVHLLSEIMSYALDDWDELGTVPLALEIDHMKKVIEMNQIRFNHMLKVKYHENIETDDAYVSYVPTLAFVTLVENAFKHGELNDEKNKVTIELEATKSKIYFLVSNKKKNGPKEPSKGIGLSNVRQRLELMYGIKHSFTIKEDENYYLNEITINL
ncbi:histidine kinase [Chryseobacterium sp. ISL-6]|uniref:sensor histidine kinase n=1 Tax=Chryseobacterium sp. ISL-6 TaxID=2819143 RepID=UPI001BE87F7D|nr:histidine kinase [Chryseobacterium sp. ISL-6]MBT2622229.1 histidine kinase [Chryseobacterium sp. ISL-6]